MKPVKFKEQTCIYAKDQDEYGNLPVRKYEDGRCVSCWKLSFWERIRILFIGKIWLSLHSFNKPLTPSFMTTKKKELIIKNKQK